MRRASVGNTGTPAMGYQHWGGAQRYHITEAMNYSDQYRSHEFFRPLQKPWILLTVTELKSKCQIHGKPNYKENMMLGKLGQVVDCSRSGPEQVNCTVLQTVTQISWQERNWRVKLTVKVVDRVTQWIEKKNKTHKITHKVYDQIQRKCRKCDLANSNKWIYKIKSKMP